MPDALKNHWLEMALGLFECFQIEVPKRAHAEFSSGSLALGATLGVFTGSEPVANIGVDRQHGHRRVIHWHELDVARTAVEQQQVACLSENGSELIHDAARH